MIVHGELECAEVPGPLDYAVLRPDSNDVLPLLYVFHGAGGSCEYLEHIAPLIERGWSEGWLPPLIAASPTVNDRGYYMNFRDGSERWEDALLGPLRDRLIDEHGADRHFALACGPSLGGTASLRYAFKRPDLFRGVAALEPGLAPALDFRDVPLRDRYWVRQDVVESIFGSPMDDALFRANHPIAIAHDDPERLRALAIYFECGGEDGMGLFRGAEMLHRILFDRGIPHEYRLVRGADHVGATLTDRFRDALSFLAKVIAPPPIDPAIAPFRAHLARLRRAAGLPDD